ncbi:MAG: DUF4271 domain-containing protein [Cyclobacteriaceae bacterium]
MRKLLSLTVLLLLALVSAAQTDTMRIRDLSADWRMLSSDEGIVPLVNSGSFSGYTLFVPVPLSQYRGNLLRLYSEDEVSLLANGQLLEIFSGSRWLSVDSLYEVYGDSVIYTLYNRPLHPFTIETDIYRLADSVTASRIRNQQVIIEGNTGAGLKNVLIASMLFILIFLTILYYYYPRLTAEFFKLRRAISFRELDENLMKTRPLSIVNISYYLLESMLAGWVLFLLIQYAEYDLRFRVFHFVGFWDGMFVWGKMVALIFVLLLLKYMVVWMFRNLFRISGFLNNHFYNYIRIGLLFYLAIALILFVTVFTTHVSDPDYYRGWLVVVLIMFALRSILIFFKLMNESSHTTLHLFSYLCATELIPLLIVLSWGINQTM